MKRGRVNAAADTALASARAGFHCREVAGPTLNRKPLTTLGVRRSFVSSTSKVTPFTTCEHRRQLSSLFSLHVAFTLSFFPR